jgi:ABC-type glutathione transport system ATPase component
MPDALIEVQGLRKTYGELVAVDDVSFSLAHGRSLAIVGESGSGKTTIAKCLTGLERPTSGSVTICGEPRFTGRVSARRRREHGRQIQIVFQDPYSSLDPRQTVAACLGEVLSLHFGLRGRPRAERIAELLEQVGLPAGTEDTHPRRLSGGQRQRVAIARALAAESEVIVLDESVAALDVSIQAQILNLLMDIREQRSLSYVFISHDLGVVRQVCDEILVMYQGRAVERGETSVVLAAPQHEHTRRLIGAVPRVGWRPQRKLVTA